MVAEVLEQVVVLSEHRVEPRHVLGRDRRLLDRLLGPICLTHVYSVRVVDAPVDGTGPAWRSGSDPNVDRRPRLSDRALALAPAPSGPGSRVNVETGGRSIIDVACRRPRSTAALKDLLSARTPDRS